MVSRGWTIGLQPSHLDLQFLSLVVKHLYSKVMDSLISSSCRSISRYSINHTNMMLENIIDINQYHVMWACYCMSVQPLRPVLAVIGFYSSLIQTYRKTFTNTFPTVYSYRIMKLTGWAWPWCSAGAKLVTCHLLPFSRMIKWFLEAQNEADSDSYLAHSGRLGNSLKNNVVPQFKKKILKPFPMTWLNADLLHHLSQMANSVHFI